MEMWGVIYISYSCGYISTQNSNFILDFVDLSSLLLSKDKIATAVWKYEINLQD